MMRLALLLLVSVAAAHPQYGPPAEQQEQGNHPATVTGGGPFTPQQSPLCSVGSDCVPWETCKDGFIDTSGTGQLDLRKGGSKPPASLGYTECGAKGNVCCQLPADIANPHNAGSGGDLSGGIVAGGGYGGSGGGGGGSGPPYPACSAGLVCVEENQCNLYTGFIGARIPLFEGQTFIEYKHCTTEFLDVGVCCQEEPAKIIEGGSGGGYGGAGGAGSGVGGGHGNAGGGGIGSGVGGGHGNAGGGGGGIFAGQGGAITGGAGVGGGHGNAGSGGIGAGVGGGHGNAGGGGIGAGVGGGHGNAGGGGIGAGVGGGHGNAGGGGIGAGVGGGHGNAGGGGIFAGQGGAITGGAGGGHSSGGGGGGGYGGGSSGALITGCSVHEDCVALIQCHNGVINTGGEGLIDLRKKPDYRTCINAEYPDAKSVCCRLPDAPPVAQACPDFTICTDRSYCDLNGFIVPDPITGAFYGGTDCYTNPAVSLNVGVCCSPAPVTAITSCPGNSLCIPEDFCFGDLLNNEGSFSPYAPGGSWSDCTLPDASGSGVCCNNPPPVVAPITEQCGVSHYGTQDDNLKTRIHVPKLDKLEADFGELPWQAIVFFSNYTFKCGATLISNKYLLTVAHCVKGLNPYDIRIRLGEWQVNTFTEPYPYQDLDVSNIFIHPDYTYGSHWNNIAILELKTPVSLEYNVNSVCLPFGGNPIPAGTRCLVSGWGKDSFTGNYQHILKKIDVPLVDHHVCQSLLRKTRLGNYFRLHDSYRCAGGEYGKDACVGDGGGPLICFDESSKSYVAVGLTAWGIGCGEKDVPGAYTDLAKFTPWISEVTGLGGSGDIVVGYGK